MKKTFFIVSILSFFYISMNGQAAFVHTADRSSISRHWTTLNHASTNNNSEAVVFVTPAQAPHNHAIGVRYFGRRWTIINEDERSMTEGSRFNVLAVQPSDNAFIHIARAGTRNGHITFIDHPRLNGRPEARILVTQRFEWSGPFNNAPIGVYFDRTNNRWGIFNENRSFIPLNAQFNVLISDQIFEVVASTPQHNSFFFNHPSTDKAVGTLVFATQTGTTVLNPQHVGVRFDVGRWGVENPRTDLRMPVNARFFILAVRPSTQTVRDVRIGVLCPTRRTGGDTEFGRAPFITFRTDLQINRDRSQLDAVIYFKAQERQPDFSTVEQTFTRTIWRAPVGMAISHLNTASSFSTTFWSHLATTELGICSDGKINHVDLHAGGMFQALQIIGDTGASDISEDEDCRCDTQIRLMEFNPIQVVLVARMF